MSRAAGNRIGPYEILSFIGAGGMGEVWKARDTRLARTVAIKFSASPFSQRFEREARAIAALNHPNICTLYDVGPEYLVMEYVEGQPLRGPMALDKALEYAKQILDALHAAHQRGVVHRDLKPDNILVSKSGIKLLDFGLAKTEPPQGLLSGDAETIGKVLTQEGVIAGTLQYMAPEQLHGGPADERADIFAFGCLFYEMLTGRPAFEGKSAASVIAAVLEREAPSIASVAPLPLDRLLKRCLAKDADDRWQAATDVKAGLELATDVGAASAGKQRRASWMPWIALAVALVVAVLTVIPLMHSRTGVPELVRFVINPPTGTDFSGPATTTVAYHQFALAPNGRAILFVATRANSKPMLWVRTMDETEARLLPGTEDAEYPFWSADSTWSVFFADGKLKKIRPTGGPIQVISDEIPNPRGGAWGPDGTILFGTGDSSIYKIFPSSRSVAPVTRLDATDNVGSHRWPQFLPDGHHFLFTVRTERPDVRGVYAASLEGETKKLLIRSDTNVLYTAPGYLLFPDGDTLMGQAFNSERLELLGQPFAVVERVGRASNGSSAVSASNTGALAYGGGGFQAGRLTWFDRGGAPLGSVGPEGYYTDFRLSPDEKHMAASLADPKAGSPSIWLIDLARGILSRFTLGLALNSAPVWSPDGSRIAFRTQRRGGGVEFYEKSSAGGGKEEPLLLSDVQRAAKNPASNLYLADWSPDGRNLLYSVSGTELWLLPLGDRMPIRLLRTSGAGIHATFSPDGRLLAYASDESGRREVYVQTLPLSDRKWQVSVGGGSEPRWKGDGREIYYLSEDRRLMAAAVAPGPSFDVPKALFQTKAVAGTGYRMHYVPSRDGRRFLVNTQIGDSIPTPITVELNWAAGLKK